MPSKKKQTLVPWELKVGDINFLKEPWILKKGKEYVTIVKENSNNGYCHLQHALKDTSIF